MLKNKYVVANWLLLAFFLFAAVAEAIPPFRPGLVDPYTGRFRTGVLLPSIRSNVGVPRQNPFGGAWPYAATAPRTGARLPGAVVMPGEAPVTPLVLLVDFPGRRAGQYMYRDTGGVTRIAPSLPPSIADGSALRSLFFDSSPTAPSVLNYWGEVSYASPPSRPYPVAGLPDNAHVVGWLHAWDGVTTDNAAPIADGASWFVSSVGYGNLAGVNTDNVQAVLNDALNHLRLQGFNLAPFARPSDNVLTGVILVHPGYGQEDSGGADPLSHTAALATRVDVGPRNTVADYTLVPALQFYSDATPDSVGSAGLPVDNSTGVSYYPDRRGDDPLVGCGVIVHEMGHLFGLPDLYPTAPDMSGGVSGTFSGVGVWDLMGYGMWGSAPFADNALSAWGNDPTAPDARRPAHLSAWSKNLLGWLTPTILSRGALGNSLPPSESSPAAFEFYQNGPGDVFAVGTEGEAFPSQYLLLEHRTPDPIVSGAIFDVGLPVSAFPSRGGVVAWRIDGEKVYGWINGSNTPLRRARTLNNDPSRPGVSVLEADADGSDLSPHLLHDIVALGVVAFGSAGDYFIPPSELSRSLPEAGANRTNLTPLVDMATVHKYDVGWITRIWNFVASGANAVFDLLAELPYWRHFVPGTTGSEPGTDGRDNVHCYAVDGSNRVWMGTDNGVWVYGFPVWSRPTGDLGSSAVQAMAWEERTSSMWVGTDRTLSKVRLDQVAFTFPTPQTIGFPNMSVRAIVVDRDSKKWIAGNANNKGVLVVLFDQGNNQPSDFLPGNYADLSFKFVPAFESGEQVNAMALDRVVSGKSEGDILYIGTSKGRLYRNAGTDNGALISNLYDPNVPSLIRFEPVRFPSAATAPTVIHSLCQDSFGTLWVGSKEGVFACERGGLPLHTKETEGKLLMNPFALRAMAGVTDNTALHYVTRSTLFPTSPAPEFSSGPSPPLVYPLGLSFQETGQLRPVIWAAYGDPDPSRAANSTTAGGALRIDANVFINPRVAGSTEDRIRHATLSLQNRADNAALGPYTNDLMGAFDDGGGNVWFSTKGGATPGTGGGAVRFGSGISLTLDKSVYLDLGARATVRLVDETVGGSTAVVTVTSVDDPTGFPLTLIRGADNVFTGVFGFSRTATDNSSVPPRILVLKSGAQVTVTYPGTRPATAIWKTIVPFEDGFFVGGCFVATAAYGSPMAPEVEVLRRFRDRTLLTNGPGRAFVSAYYRFSPPLAEFIGGRPRLRAATRFFLAPLLLFASVSVPGGGAVAGLGILLLAACAVAAMRARRLAGGGRLPWGRG